jgi:hypothetical protein
MLSGLKVIAFCPGTIIANNKAASVMNRLNHGLQEVVLAMLSRQNLA